jgi:uncharacterized protein YyaL (SSP411 family)
MSERDEQHAVGNADFRFSPRPNRAGEIEWRDWGDNAFAEARRLGRPVLLSLSAVWCHWCHVMDETSYSDPQVIHLVNTRYVPVRVDNDRRPDINRRYNMGGWPTTAFLTPNGEVLTGATYLPPEHMVDALRRVDAFYAEHREELERPAGGPAKAEPEAADGPAAGRTTLTSRPAAPAVQRQAEAVEWIRRQVIDAYDPLCGGFGTQPKFPQADALNLLLLRAASCRDQRVDAALTKTLRSMAQGAVYEHVQDGFFRYATRRDWSEPHYEKMLEDNARLLRIYAEAYGVLGDAAFAETARGIARYLLAVLWRPQAGAFAGSQDADEHYYGLDADGRRRLQPPFVDPTVYVDWNALAASGLLRAAQLLAQPEFAEPALTALDTIWERAHDRHGMAHYLTSAPGPAGNGKQGPLRAGSVAGLLGDQATVAAALLDAYEHSGQRAYLARASLLVDWTDQHLSTPDGGVADRLPSADAGPLAQTAPDLAEASLLADVLLRLAVYTGEQRYRERAAALLATLEPAYRQYGLMAAPYAAALARHIEPQLHVVVVGGGERPDTQALLRAAVALRAPLRTAQLLDPDADLEHIVRDGYAAGASAVAYVCLGSTCLPPVSKPDELAAVATGGGRGARRAEETPGGPRHVEG